MSKKVFILNNPNRNSVNNYNKITVGVGGQKVEEKEAFARAPYTKETFVGASVSKTKPGTLDTGLDFMGDNPYSDEAHYRSIDFERALKGKEKALFQHILEFKHGKDYDTYSNIKNVDLSGNVKDPKKVSFLQSAEALYSLNDGTTILDLDNPKDELTYYLCRANPDIAPSFQELSQSNKWYIAKEEEAASQKISSKKVINSAAGKLAELEGRKDNTLQKVFKVLFLSKAGGQSYKRLSDDQAYEELDTFITDKGKAKQNVGVFMNVVRKIDDNPVEFEAQALIFDLITYNVLYKKGGGYTWVPPKEGNENATKEIVEFDRLEEVVKYVSNPKYEPELTAMKSQLEAKKL